MIMLVEVLKQLSPFQHRVEVIIYHRARRIRQTIARWLTVLLAVRIAVRIEVRMAPLRMLT